MTRPYPPPPCVARTLFQNADAKFETRSRTGDTHPDHTHSSVETEAIFRPNLDRGSVIWLRLPRLDRLAALG